MIRIKEFIGRRLGMVPAPVEEKADSNSGGLPARTSEQGSRATPENRIKYIYRIMWVDPDVRATILDIRQMDRSDPRVKKIHGRTARAAVKGGLKIRTSSANKRLLRAWSQFERRLQLHRREKLESDMRGLMMEGNLPLQWVLGMDQRVVAGVRMPSETLLPKVSANGTFTDPKVAYEQFELETGIRIASFPLWRLSLVRLTPDNWDDMGSMGRPYLDATREIWTKLRMTEEDLVVRRRERAPLRTAHVLEGATPEELDDYKERVEDDQKEITTNYYLNKKGAVSAVQGDANLDQIADVVHLLDTFFAGSPAPKGLFGYAGELQRDILEDLKRDYYDELDALQDTASFVYELGFRLDLLLQGVNPDNYDFGIQYAERRTDTANQRADLALKYQAMSVPPEMVWESAGLNPHEVLEAIEAQANSRDPYPDAGGGMNPPPGTPRVSVTPGNQRKGESATTISTRG